MGFLKPPKVKIPEPTPTPVIDSDAVEQAAQDEARRAARRRGAGDTILRRNGGLAGALRATVGGGSQ